MALDKFISFGVEISDLALKRLDLFLEVFIAKLFVRKRKFVKVHIVDLHFEFLDFDFLFAHDFTCLAVVLDSLSAYLLDVSIFFLSQPCEIRIKLHYLILSVGIDSSIRP